MEAAVYLSAKIEKRDIMKKIKSLIVGMVIAVGVTAIPACAYALGPLPPSDISEFGTPVTIHINGKYISTDVPPDFINSRTFLPMRVIAESMDAQVYWDNNQQCAHVEKDGKEIEFYVGDTTYYINGMAKISDVAPYIKDGRTMLPVRALSEALDASVLWDQSWADVQITTEGDVTQSPTLPEDIPWQVQWLVEKYYVEPTDDGCGSWYFQEKNGDITSSKYIFVSNAQGGQKAFAMIFMFMTETNMLNSPALLVFTGLLEENNEEYSAVLNNQVYSYNSIGGLGNRLNTYHFKLLPNNGFILTGHTLQGLFDEVRIDMSVPFDLIG